MKCPACHAVIRTVPCWDCGRELPAEVLPSGTVEALSAARAALTDVTEAIEPGDENEDLAILALVALTDIRRVFEALKETP